MVDDSWQISYNSHAHECHPFVPDESLEGSCATMVKPPTLTLYREGQCPVSHEEVAPALRQLVCCPQYICRTVQYLMGALRAKVQQAGEEHMNKQQTQPQRSPRECLGLRPNRLPRAHGLGEGSPWTTGKTDDAVLTRKTKPHTYSLMRSTLRRKKCGMILTSCDSSRMDRTEDPVEDIAK